MKNPWLNIPASDYEGHMSLPEVDQLSFIGNVFKESLVKFNSSSLVYLGCTTGNGLEYVDIQKTTQLTVIDINPEYLEILKDRYQSKIPNLDIIEADLNDYKGIHNKYSLVFAGLLFEYLPAKPLLAKIENFLEKTGVMVVVLQLHEQNTKKVSDTLYSSLKQLDSIMNLISDQDFKIMARESGMREIDKEKFTLKSGKSFYVGTYERIA